MIQVDWLHGGMCGANAGNPPFALHALAWAMFLAASGTCMETGQREIACTGISATFCPGRLLCSREWRLCQLGAVNIFFNNMVLLESPSIGRLYDVITSDNYLETDFCRPDACTDKGWQDKLVEVKQSSMASITKQKHHA